MNIDLAMVAQLGTEMGMAVRDVPPNQVDLVLEPGVVLVFRNLPESSDSLMGFEDFGWHVHGDLPCSDKRGFCVELSYLDIVTGIADGSVLVCELVENGRIQRRCLVHRDYFDEIGRLVAGQEIRVRRIKVGGFRQAEEREV